MWPVKYLISYYLIVNVTLLINQNVHVYPLCLQGEVLKTRGGGRAILFTDIETLKQELTPVPR